MVEKGIRGRIGHAIYQYVKADNKQLNYVEFSHHEQLKDYNKNKKSSCLMYWDASRLH